MIGNDNTTISIITVCFDNLSGLKATVDSVSAQNAVSMEHIIIDGGSSDGTKEYLLGLCHDGLHWISERDNGIYDAMNKGIDISCGKYVLFLNAGDVFFNEMSLNTVLDTLSETNYLFDTLFYGATLVLGSGSGHYRKARGFEYVWHGVPANHQATLYRRSIMPKYPTKFVICGDYYAAAKLFLLGAKQLVIDVPIVKFDMGGVSSKRLLRLCIEAWTIQRDVLQLNLYWRIVSTVRRLMSMLGVKALSLAGLRNTED